MTDNGHRPVPQPEVTRDKAKRGESGCSHAKELPCLRVEVRVRWWYWNFYNRNGCMGAHLTDNDWLDSLLSSEAVGDPAMPGFPDAGVQESSVGRSGAAAIQEAFKFYRFILDNASVTASTKVLDFGVGWGRILRMFTREIPASNLYGVDIDPDIINWCKQNRVAGNLNLTKPGRPLPYRSRTFDLVYAYSVFSHLSEDAATVAMNQIARVLKPGGLFIFTTHQLHFLHMCVACSALENPDQAQQAFKEIFADPVSALDDYQAGKFVYSAAGGGIYREPNFFGWTAIPNSYIQDRWKHFEILQIVADTRYFEQSIFVLKREPSATRRKLDAAWLATRNMIASLRSAS
jgi:SAM-dependent methyltransferase